MKLLIFLALVQAISANNCNRNQYWSDDLKACISCQTCGKNQILLRPCSTHRDTECSTISHSGLEYPWLDKDKDNDIFELADDDKPKSSKKGDKKNRHILKLEADPVGDDDIYQDFLHSKHDGKKSDRSHKKHNKKHHFKFGQRVNDKFLKWDDDFSTTKRPHRNRLIVGPYSNWHHGSHYAFPAETDDSRSRKSDKRGKSLHDKAADHSKRKAKKSYAQDEEQLEEWLEKELAQRKQDLLKNIKKDEYAQESGQRVKLNYPIFSGENDLVPSATINDDHDASMDNLKSILNDDQKDSQYRTDAAASHHMFMGEPSTISEIIGQVKDPHEVSKGKVSGSNFIYEKSKLSVLPVDLDDNVVAAVPFTAVERFVWDWQAVAFISAVTACLLFFMVLTVYSLLNAGQQKRSKAACYTADMEEMSTRVALMQPTFEVSTTEGLTLTKYPNPAPTHKI